MDITIQQHPKPKPILGACFPQIFLPKHEIPQIKPQDQTSRAILKYFPKHIHSLPSDLSHLKTRIKHLKIIEKIPNHHPNNLLKVLLSTKRKNVKSIPEVQDPGCQGGYNKKNLGLLKMFPNLQKVELSATILNNEDEEGDENYPIYQAKEWYWLEKMSNYLSSMKNLKSLTLSNHGRCSLPLLSKVSSFETMLSLLKVFKLEFGLFITEEFSYFQALFDYKTIFKHLTHLSLNLPNEKRFFELYQLLPAYCPQLVSLSSLLHHKNPLSPSEDVSCLQCLQHFQNLQKLSLYSQYQLDVFRHCKFPRSLRYLDLSFYEADWRSLMAEDSSTIPVFHQKQEGLEKLEKLQIFIFGYQSVNEGHIIKDFVKDFLSQVLTLREFNIEFSPRFRDQNPYYSFDLSHFFGHLQHLSQSLQRLTVNNGHGHGEYNFINFLETQAFHFPELSFLTLQCGNLPSLPEVENIIELVQAKPDAPAPEIKLEKIKVDSWKSLFELFNSLKRISEKKQIELVVFHVNNEGDHEYFKDNYEQIKKESRNLKNVSLHLRLKNGPKFFRWIKELKSFETVFGNFRLTENAYN